MTYRNKKQQSQSGVTLLLSVLVLAAIAAISFSLATVTFIELRSSGDILRTEPAFYAAESAIEESTFRIKRGVSNTTYPYFPLSNSIINKVRLDMLNLPNPTGYQDATGVVLTVPASSTYANTSAVVYFVDPNNVNGANANYAHITLTNLSSNTAIQYLLCPVSDTDCEGTGAGWTWGSGLTLSAPGGVADNTSLNVAKSYVLYLFTSDSTVGYVKVQAWDGAGVAQGTAFLGKQLVKITATYSGLTRVYQAVVPTD